MKKAKLIELIKNARLVAEQGINAPPGASHYPWAIGAVTAVLVNRALGTTSEDEIWDVLFEEDAGETADSD